MWYPLKYKDVPLQIVKIKNFVAKSFFMSTSVSDYFKCEKEWKGGREMFSLRLSMKVKV